MVTLTDAEELEQPAAPGGMRFSSLVWLFVLVSAAAFWLGFWVYG